MTPPTARWRAIAAGLLAACPLAMLETFPGLRFSLAPGLNADIHTALEVVSIVVSAMIFSVSWHTLVWNRSSKSALVCTLFGCVATADLAHVIAFEATSALGTGSAVARVFIPFFVARLVAAAALLLLALDFSLTAPPRAARHWLGVLAISVGVAAGALALDAQESGVFFVPGVGLSHVKIWLEALLIVLNLVAAGLFLRRFRQGGDAHWLILATALGIMALSEFSFARYSSLTDVYFVYGHVLKVVAYVALYHTLFRRMISRPFEELVVARNQLAVTSARWQMLFEHSLDAVVIGTPDGGVVAANPAACHLFGMSESELVAKGRVGIAAPGDPRLDQLVQVRSIQGFARGEVSFQRGDGSTFEAEVASAVFNDNHGRPLTSVLIRDISERKAFESRIVALNSSLEERVLQRTGELAQANSELAQFSWGIAHDLRAPLAAIGGFAGAIQANFYNDLPVKGQHYLRRIVANVSRMEGLIDSILSLYRISHSPIRHDDLDLSAMSQQVAEELAFSEPSRRVLFEIAPGLMARGDRALILSLLQNLIGNAWKFTRSTQEPVIQFGADPTLGNGWFIRDNGVGFESTQAGELFKMFRRLHDQADFSGHGLGLAGAKRIVERHGGTIDIQAQPGKGAIVRFSLSPA